MTDREQERELRRGVKAERERIKALLDDEERKLEAYIAERCTGDDPIKQHARTVADARLSEVHVLRRALVGKEE